MPEVEYGVIRNIGSILCDKKRPLKERFRALFTLRNLKGELSVKCIGDVFDDPSALLKHECAYCLGQMQDAAAIPILERVLLDENQDPIVRHEAAEALGAIGSPSSLDILQKHRKHAEKVISETCDLAVRRISWCMENNDADLTEKSYDGVDPTPAEKTSKVMDLESILLDDSRILYDRYKAMFALRNNGNSESIASLCKGLKVGSALYRHEIAFVLGQLQKEESVSSLINSLKDESEHEMVRHECAEALGSIATDECIEILKKYLSDPSRVVRESCEVALDMCDYENNEEFQYADALIKAS